MSTRKIHFGWRLALQKFLFKLFNPANLRSFAFPPKCNFFSFCGKFLEVRIGVSLYFFQPFQFSFFGARTAFFISIGIFICVGIFSSLYGPLSRSFFFLTFIYSCRNNLVIARVSSLFFVSFPWLTRELSLSSFSFPWNYYDSSTFSPFSFAAHFS